MAEEAVSGVPLVGSRISLISKKDIRYEGVLFSINTNDASLALQHGEFLLHEQFPSFSWYDTERTTHEMIRASSRTRMHALLWPPLLRALPPCCSTKFQGAVRKGFFDQGL